jgi:uncharacterized protein (DUF305 family)
MIIRTLAVAACIAVLPTITLAQDTMQGMDMKNMPMGHGPADEGYMKAMQGMHQSMMSMKPTGDADKDFVSMMIPHHQAAVDMAEVELKYGKDKKIRKMAEDIIRSQKKEIEEMMAWQAKNSR